jgi:hypothetical protein
MTFIKTSCKKCIFKTEDETGLQIGCKLGRLQKYVDKNQAELETSTNSYLINTLCRGCKANDQFSIDKTTPEIVRQEMEISSTFIIDGSTDYWRFLKDILKQELMPKFVYVVINKAFTESEKYMEYLNYFKDAGSNLSIKRYYEEKTFLECVDDILEKVNTQYYTILSPEEDLDPKYLKNIDIKINDNMEPLIAILSDGDYKNTFSVYLHKLAYGNYQKKLKDKVIEQAEQEGKKDNIWFL